MDDDLKQAKKVFSTLGACYIAGTVCVQLLRLLMSEVVLEIMPQWQEDININLLLSCVITYGCGMPLIVLLAKRLQTQTPERHKMKWWQFVLALMITYSMVYISNFIGIIATAIIGYLKGSAVQNGLLDTVTGSSLWVNVLAMVVLAPIVEEYVFRKVIVDRTLQYGEGMAIATSGVMFGLFHGNLNQFVYAVVLGCFFAFLYIRTGKLKITIGMHAVVNFMGGVIAPVLIRLIDMDELLALNPNGPGYQDAVMAYVMDNLAGWIVLMVYAFSLFAVVIAGFILFIVFFKRFKLQQKETDIPKGKRFQTLMLNPGMIVFCLVWVALIILQLFE